MLYYAESLLHKRKIVQSGSFARRDTFTRGVTLARGDTSTLKLTSVQSNIFARRVNFYAPYYVVTFARLR